ncbi:Uncharacterised protein r2_g1086 [Pycnogonum litorale]
MRRLDNVTCTLQSDVVATFGRRHCYRSYVTDNVNTTSHSAVIRPSFCHRRCLAVRHSSNNDVVQTLYDVTVTSLCNVVRTSFCKVQATSLRNVIRTSFRDVTGSLRNYVVVRRQIVCWVHICVGMAAITLMK